MDLISLWGLQRKLLTWKCCDGKLGNVVIENYIEKAFEIIWTCIATELSKIEQTVCDS